MSGESIAEMNSAFAAARAERVSTALTNALQQKAIAPPEKSGIPKAKKVSAPAPAASPSATPSATPAPSAESSAASADFSVPDIQAALGEVPDAAAPDAGADPAAAQDDPAAAEDDGSPAVAPEVAELQELGRKKDLRALEKKLGLEEGSLGVNNGSWKAYRNRLAEVEAKETSVNATHAQNEAALIAKFGTPYQLIESAKKGDLIAYAQSIEHTTGISIGKFIQLWSQNVQAVNPRELELERENLRLRGATQQQQPAAATEPAAATDTPAAAAIAKANTYLTAEAKDHPALKLKGGLDEVRAKWLASFSKAEKKFKLTPKAAADAVVAERKAAREQESWILAGKIPPAAPTTKTLPRRGASETHVPKANMTRNEIIEQAAANWQRQKQASRKK